MVTENVPLMEIFEKNKKAIYSIVIFQEFLKEVVSCLFSKEMICEMVEAYELA